MNALDYLLKANLYGLLFAGCYILLLRRHTFFGLNRAYLLASVALSLVLPLAMLPSQAPETLPIPTGIITLPITEPILPTVIQPAETGPDWETWSAWGYGLVVLVLLIGLLTRVHNLLRIIRQSAKVDQRAYTLVLPTNWSIPTFSFFRYVVLNPADQDNSLILQHELVHVRQWHSVDVLTIQLLRIIFWACPALWLLERALRQVHEFLADQQASAYEQNYARLLVDYSFGLQPVSLANGFFNPSLLKQRIQMLQQRATSRWALGKYILIAPLTLGLLAMTTAREEITELVTEQTTDKQITVSGRVTSAVDGKALPGAVLMNGTKMATTDQNGLYKLNTIDSKGKLVISSLGYRTDMLLLTSMIRQIKKGVLTLNINLTPTLEDELPAMGATANYKAVKPNPSMPLTIVPNQIVKAGKVFKAVSEQALFPTGIPGLMNYVANNLHYPTKARAASLEGDVYVLFSVSSTGKVTDAKVNKTLKSVGGGCEEEAIRVVSKMPNWIPAKQNGQPVAVRYHIPIRFELEHTDDKRTGMANPRQSKLRTPIAYGNSKNTRFGLYNDVNPRAFPLPDSLRKAKVSVKAPSGTKPLYIIDGVERLNQEIEALDPNTIESINVLKGDLSAMYGVRGKDGVILITTKKK